MALKTYRIFLASSSELAYERSLVTGIVADFKAKRPDLHCDFEVVKWENFASSYEDARKQDAYNEAIKSSDVFLMLYWTKVGMYTQEEFEVAIETQKIKAKPYLFLLKKSDGTSVEDSVKQFEDKVPHGNGKFSGTFATEKELRGDIEDELNKLFKDGFLKSGQPAILLSTKAVDEPQGFIGREDELKIIREKLRNQGGKLMLINAEGGIGKTTLAAKYWNYSLHEYKYNAWLFCEVGIINALKDLAPKLNLDLAGMNEQQQLDALRLALSEKQDGFLLVLDNANDEEDIKIFKQEFEGFHWHVLITSRCQGVLDREQELPITHLPPPLAKELFERYYKEDSPDFDAYLDKVLHAIQYHTLLTEVFAKNLAEAAELGHLNLKTFLDKLENEGLHLGKHSFEIENNDWAAKRKAATTDEILDALYDFGQLSPEQDFLMVNMALLPAEPYTLAFINSLLANDTNSIDRQIRDTLKALVKKGWIGETEKKYRLSPVIQKLVLDKHQESLENDSQHLLKRLNQLTETDGFDILRLSLSDAKPYIKPSHFLNKVLKNYPCQNLGNYNFNVGIFYENIGDIYNAKLIHLNYKIIYEILIKKEPKNLNYKEGLAISHEKLGAIYMKIGDLKNSFFYFQEYNLLSKKIFENNPENLHFKKNLAVSYFKLGEIYENTGDLKKAQLNYQNDFKINLEIYKNNRFDVINKNFLAISYGKIGEIYTKIGNESYAISNQKKANKYFKEINEVSPSNLHYKYDLAISYSKLGEIYEQKGDFTKALFNYKENFRLSKEIYDVESQNLSYKNNMAISYSKLSGIFERSEEWENALSNCQEYFRINIECLKMSPQNINFKYNLANSYGKMGFIYENIGEKTKAFLNYEYANYYFKEVYKKSPLNLSYKNGLAISLASLGKFYLKQNDLGNSLTHYLESRTLFAELWQATQGQIVLFTYYFALNTKYTTEIVKSLIEQGYYPADQVPGIKEGIKAIRQEGYAAIKPLAEAGNLQESQMWLVKELGDEGWYEF